MIEAVKICFNKYANFNGRASRSEYWWFFLFVIVLDIIANAININLYFIIVVGLFLPSLAVLIRRLHDTNTSGWFALLLLIPLIGPLVLLYFMVIKGTEGPNNYGLPVA